MRTQDDADPCRDSNQQRDEPFAVVVSLADSSNMVPGFTDDRPSAMYYVECPAAASAEGAEIVPDNPFPVE